MKKILVMCLFVVNAVAFDSVHIGGGALYNMPDTDSSLVSDENTFSLQFGVIAKKELNTEFNFRTGALYQRKNGTMEIDILSVDADYSVDYLVVPATITYELQDGLDLLAGLNLGLQIADDCEASSNSSSCDVDDAESLLISFVIGASKEINDEFTGEAYIEKSSGELFGETEMTSLVFNVLYKI